MIPRENTLGIFFGGASKRKVPEATGRVIRASTRRRSQLGTSFIGVGAAIIVGLRSIYEISWFIAFWKAYPEPYLALFSWVMLLITLAAAIVVARLLGDRMPNWIFALFLLGLAVSAALDLYAIWPLHEISRYETAATTVGMGLLVVISLRRSIDMLIPIGLFGAALIAAIIINTSWESSTVAAQITTVAFAVLPTVIGVFIVSGFRRLVQVELDRVLIQSTVSAPRFAVGMLASEELARLDLAAEELLDSVATGATKLPLDPKMASVAASLATELRLHLIEGRRETWLYHAITESNLLSKAVTLADKSNLAGLLDAKQRDGLLSAAWLLVTGSTKGGRTVHITLGPVTSSDEDRSEQKISIPIIITTTGVPRNRVDPATWEAIRRIGPFSDSTENQSLRAEMVAQVDNPANQ